MKGFSRGMKQRLGIAQALLNRPKLLICDEPTSALDPLGRKEILDILVAAKEETTILFSTHILSDVEHICDEMALLNEGKIIMQGSIDEVKSIRRGNALEIQLERKEDSDSLYRFICEKTKAHKAGSVGKTERNGSKNIIIKEASLLPYALNYIADNNIPFIKIEKQESTLEDIFLEAIK